MNTAHPVSLDALLSELDRLLIATRRSRRVTLAPLDYDDLRTRGDVDRMRFCCEFRTPHGEAIVKKNGSTRELAVVECIKFLRHEQAMNAYVNDECDAGFAGAAE